jgi:uncharacterized RDD family membrane protein YckC
MRARRYASGMTESPPTTAAEPAHLGWRLLAMLYDAMPLLAIWMLCSLILLVARGGQPVVPGSAGSWLSFAVLWIVTGLYATLSWQRGGQTLGMRPWRLRIVDEQGRNAGWAKLWLRYAWASVSLATVVGMLWSLFDRERRTWHDLLSHTRMVRVLPG